MRFTTFTLAVATTVLAQRPSDTPICDYYTTALLKENNATNQATLLTLLVNTVVIGNCKCIYCRYRLKQGFYAHEMLHLPGHRQAS